MSKTPKLRFKEFSGDWESKKLKDLCSDFIVPMRDKPQVFDGDIPWCRVEDVEDKYLNDTKSNQYVSQEIVEKMNLKVYPTGTLICACSGATIGTNAITTKPLITNQTFIGIVCKNINTEYLYYLMKLQKRNLERIAGGTSIPYISRKKFEEFNIIVPTIKEQNKIASFFSLIDDKITLQDEKVEALKDYKRGMMQKIFSRELRFKDDDSRYYPEWKEKKIKDIFTVTRGVVIAKNEISDLRDNINQYPVYSSQTSNNGILGYDSKYDFEGDYLTWTTDGANAGKVFRRNGKFRCTNVCGVLVEKEETLGFANKMISEFLNKETPKHVSYVGNPKLMNGVMGDIKIKVPILDEQLKIAKILDNIDLKIEKEQEKLDSLKQYKKGLLQQMFI